MWELLRRLWKDAVFMLAATAAVASAWEVASDSTPVWVNITAAATAAVAAGWSAQANRLNSG